VNDLRSDLASLRIDRTGPPPPNRLLRGLGIAAVVALALVAVQSGVRPLVEERFLRVEVAATEVAMLSPSQAAVDLTSTGYVVPQVTAKVSAKLVGRISKSDVKEGQTVKAGDLLFEFDGADQLAVAASARARVASASARSLTVRAQRSELDVELARQKRLLDAGAVARAPLEDLTAKAATLDTQIKAADADVNAASAEAEAAQVQLKHLKLFAPIDGTVMTKPAVVGDVASPGVPLLELADFASLLVEADVTEARLAIVKEGGPCEIALDAVPGKTFPGKVVEVGPKLNRAKATATVKVRFDAPPTELRPEMSARVSFLQKALEPAQRAEAAKPVVPAAAVVERGDGKVVFVLEGGKVKLVPVVLGDAVGSGFVLKQGPAPGTRLVKEPPKELADGQSVKEKTS
jgi:HlyD family secretion protein